MCVLCECVGIEVQLSLCVFVLCLCCVFVWWWCVVVVGGGGGRCVLCVGVHVVVVGSGYPCVWEGLCAGG